jgi:hypothetical protein
METIGAVALRDEFIDEVLELRVGAGQMRGIDVNQAGLALEEPPFGKDTLRRRIVQGNELGDLGVDLQLAEALGRGDAVVAIQDVVGTSELIQPDRWKCDAFLHRGKNTL